MYLNGKLNQLRGQYDCLTAFERLQAVVAASGRNDQTERVALLDACPPGQQAEYRRLVQAAAGIGEMLTVDLLAKYVAYLQSGRPELLHLAAAEWAGFCAFCEDIGIRPGLFLGLAYVGGGRENHRRGGDELLATVVFDNLIELLEAAAPDSGEAIEAARADKHLIWNDLAG